MELDLSFNKITTLEGMKVRIVPQTTPIVEYSPAVPKSQCFTPSAVTVRCRAFEFSTLTTLNLRGTVLTVSVVVLYQNVGVKDIID